MVDSMKAELEFGAPAMDTIITLTETGVDGHSSDGTD